MTKANSVVASVTQQSRQSSTVYSNQSQRWTWAIYNTTKPSWSKGDARQQCVYKDPWQI